MKNKKPILFTSSIILAIITSVVFGYLGLSILYLLIPFLLVIIATLTINLERPNAVAEEALAGK